MSLPELPMVEPTHYHQGYGVREHSKGRWWAIIRKATINLLVGVYPTAEEALVAYNEAQSAYNEERLKEKEAIEKRNEERRKAASNVTR
jgi:hypothetical protein